MSDNTILQVRNITRLFSKEQFVAVDDVSFDIHEGEVYALVGPNGAGKTTTVRMCSTLLTPSSGSITIEGIDAVRYPQRARSQLGLVLGGDLGFYPRASALDNLMFFADIAGIPGSQRHEEVHSALQRVGLLERKSSKVGEFSRGMKQRLHIARALLGHPRLLLLDEPTSGLDPEAALSVRDLVAELAREHVGILLTSHSMNEVEELASVISVIGGGRIAVTGGVADIAQYAGIRATTTATLPARAVTVQNRITEMLQNAADVHFRPKGSVWSVTIHWKTDWHQYEPKLLQLLEEHNAYAPDFSTHPASLEDAYLAISDDLQR